MLKSRAKNLFGLLSLLVCFQAHAVINFGGEDIISEASILVDNIKIDGNTISSNNTNGDIILNPNGTGGVQFPDLTASRALVLNGSKLLTSSSVTDTELGYLSGVTGGIQTQLDSKPNSATLSDNRLIRGDGTAAIQSSGITVSDADGISGVSTLAMGGALTGVTDGTLSGNLNLPIAVFDGQASAPANPAAGYFKVYVDDTSGKAKILNSSGVVSSLGGGSGSSGINMLADYNRDAEQGTSYWSNSGGTFTTTTTAADVGNGLASFSYDAGVASQYVMSDSRAIPEALKGANCLAETYYKGFDSAMQFAVYDGTLTNVISSQQLTASTGYTKIQLNFPCPSSGSMRAGFVSAGNPAIGYWDEVHLGSASNISNVSQAKLLGKLKITSCNTAWSRANTALGAFSAVTSCVYTTEGQASGPATMIPAIRFASGIPPGTIKIVAHGYFAKATGSPATNADAFWAFNDGSTTFSVQGTGHVSGGGAGTAIPEISGSKTYTTAQGDTTIQIYGAVTNTATSTSNLIYGNTSGLNGGTLTDGLEFEVWHYPSSYQSAVNANADNWRVDASISGANPSLGTGDVASYTGIEDAGLTLTNNTGQNIITAQIPCSSTNSPSGTTCAAGSESIGVSFPIPKAQDVRACADFTHEAGPVTSIGNNFSTAFQIVETPNNAQTISQEGKTKVTHRTYIEQSTNAMVDAQSMHVCGNFSFSSAGQKTLRLMYEQLRHTGTINTNVIYGDALSTVGQRDIHWTVEPLSTPTAAPILVGSVTSGSSGALRIETAKLDCDGTPATNYESSDWINGIPGTISSGACSVTFNSGQFSVAPVCHLTINNCSAASGGSCFPYYSVVPATTGFTMKAASDSGALATAFIADVMCIGPR